MTIVSSVLFTYTAIPYLRQTETSLVKKQEGRWCHITEGLAAVEQHALTGESQPAEKHVGE